MLQPQWSFTPVAIANILVVVRAWLRCDSNTIKWVFINTDGIWHYEVLTGVNSYPADLIYSVSICLYAPVLMWIIMPCLPIFCLHTFNKTFANLSPSNLVIRLPFLIMCFSNLIDIKEGRWSVVSWKSNPVFIFLLSAVETKIWSTQLAENFRISRWQDYVRQKSIAKSG